MNEIDLIIKRLERNGSPVDDVFYYTEGIVTGTSPYALNIGLVSGYPVGKCWFFGNVGMAITIGGVIVLTDINTLFMRFGSTFRGIDDLGPVDIYKGVNNGVNLRGDGQYQGNSKIYQIGFNWVTAVKQGFGAATFILDFAFNGFLFILK